MKKLFALVALMTTAASAQIVAPAGNQIVVAHDGIVEIHNPRGGAPQKHAGVANASAVVVGSDRVAILDSYANQVRLIPGDVVRTAETPIAGVFIGNDLFIMARDARTLERIRPDGSRRSVAVAADPSFLREAGGTIYVYSRLEGLVQEIDPVAMRVVRRATIAPFASDFETDGRNGYILLPREGLIRTFPLRTLEAGTTIAAGSVPTDLAVTGGASAFSAVRLAVADPSARRVWTIEGAQSVGGAFGRGFVRGLLGLGLYRPRDTDFPGGVDRILSRGGITLAYDSSTQTLYRVGKKSRAVVSAVGPDAFAIVGDRIVFWRDGALRYAP